MNLNETEMKVFTLLKSRQDGVGVDELVKLMGARRQSVTVRMKYLSAKLAPHGWIIENVSGPQGRGRKAHYTIRKKF